MRPLKTILNFIFFIGVVLVFHADLREEGTVYSHFLMGIYVLFGMGGLALIFKKYIYYQYADIRVAFLNRKSDYIDDLLFKIVMICLIALLNIAFFNWGLYNRHTVLLLTCTIVAIVGISLNVRPALLMTQQGFYYDNYIPILWKWEKIQGIDFFEDRVLIRGQHQDFEVHLNLLQKEDNLRSRILSSEIQQFGGGPVDFQNWLHSYAVAFNISTF